MLSGRRNCTVSQLHITTLLPRYAEPQSHGKARGRHGEERRGGASARGDAHSPRMYYVIVHSFGINFCSFLYQKPRRLWGASLTYFPYLHINAEIFYDSVGDERMDGIR